MSNRKPFYKGKKHYEWLVQKITEIGAGNFQALKELDEFTRTNFNTENYEYEMQHNKLVHRIQKYNGGYTVVRNWDLVEMDEPFIWLDVNHKPIFDFLFETGTVYYVIRDFGQGRVKLD